MSLAPIAVADQGSRFGRGVLESSNQLGEALGLQAVPEYLGQAAGKAVETVDEQPGMFDEHRLADHLERHQQLVADQLIKVFGAQLLDADRKGLHLDSTGLEDLANLADLLLIDGREADFHRTSQLRLRGERVSLWSTHACMTQGRGLGSPAWRISPSRRYAIIDANGGLNASQDVQARRPAQGHAFGCLRRADRLGHCAQF